MIDGSFVQWYHRGSTLLYRKGNLRVVSDTLSFYETSCYSVVNPYNILADNYSWESTNSEAQCNYDNKLSNSVKILTAERVLDSELVKMGINLYDNFIMAFLQKSQSSSGYDYFFIFGIRYNTLTKGLFVNQQDYGSFIIEYGYKICQMLLYHTNNNEIE
jgi:hypothetical protein